jgi:hypothetical protein
MKIIDCEQGTAEWFEARRGVMTASRIGMFCANPKQLTLTIPQIQIVLTELGIPHKKSAAKLELISLLPEPEKFMDFSPAVKTLILEILGEQADCDDRPPEFDTFWTKRGKELEPVARAKYAEKMGIHVSEVGICIHDSGYFGCSPDGLIYTQEGNLSWGLEIKCHQGKVHLSHLLDGGLPEEHMMQVHASMAVTGADRWDYYGFHPNLPPLHVITMRDSFTDQLERGLVEIGNELKTYQSKVAKLYFEHFGKGGKDAA